MTKRDSALALATVGEVCDEHLKRLERCFVPEMRMTLVIRHVSEPDVFLVLTKDNVVEVIELLRRHVAVSTPPTPRAEGTDGGEVGR